MLEIHASALLGSMPLWDIKVNGGFNSALFNEMDYYSALNECFMETFSYVAIFYWLNVGVIFRLVMVTGLLNAQLTE